MPFTVADLKNRFSPRCWAAVVAVGGAAVLSGCVVAPLDDGYTDYGYSSTTVYTQYGYPPPPRVEYRTIAPSASHVWVGGDWYWHDSRYDWRPGRWAPPGYRYMPPPPPRPMVRPPRPQVLPMPRPDRPPMVRPDERPRAPLFRLGGGNRPQPPEGHPDSRPQPPQGGRPSFGWQRPQQMQPDRPNPPPQQVRPDGPRPDNARPPRRDNDDRGGPPQWRDRDGDRERR